jgi:hypothetical protein
LRFDICISVIFENITGFNGKTYFFADIYAFSQGKKIPYLSSVQYRKPAIQK